MDFRRIAELFEAALQQPKAVRSEWLAEVCPDELLRREVEDMLSAHERADGVLDRSLGTVAERALELHGGGTARTVGRYRLLGELGRGGMGVVYKALDPRLNRFVALKFLPPNIALDDEVKARFVAEAKAASALDHPNICTIYDIGEAVTGQLYISMAHYEGETLAKAIERGPLPEEMAVDLATQIALGLECAHEKGIVHRDIKPSNIMVTARGVAKILDFGIAKLEGETTVTRPGAVVGTPAYVAPERFLGEEAGTASDLWSLGVVTFEMLTGRRPFAGAGLTVIHAITHDEPQQLRALRPELSADLEAVVLRLLAKSPGERFEGAGKLAASLQALGNARGAAHFDRSPSSVSSGELPTPLTSFFGRERELEQILRLLEEARLVTLTGPAGTGKTRLALQVARVLRERVAPETSFVSLSSLTDARLVASVIARALGLRESPGGDTLPRLQAALRDRRLFLVLDNFERVAAAASLVVELLENCPHLRVLVTSRVPLRVSGEHEYPVAPLALPPRGERPSLDELRGYSAIRLFVDRARALRPDFELTDGNAAAVAELCARLDGLPLTIELAAARIKLLSPEAMLARLGARLDLLKGGARDRPERHRTLREALAWSYELLDEGERCLFRRLAIFVGGCSLEAAEALCRLEPRPIMEALDGLDALVDQSLLRQEASKDGEPRFVMLETIRAYGLELLLHAGELERVRRAHALYYLDLAERAATELTGADQGWWLDLLELEHDNLRAALSWSATHEEAELGMRLGSALWRFWIARGYMNEGRRHLEQLLALPGGGKARIARARALNGLGTLAHNQGDNHEARRVLEESLGLFRDAGDKQGTAAVLNNLAWVACEVCDFEVGEALANEALRLCRELGDRRGCALAINNLGWIANYRGEWKRAREFHSESLALRREIGDHRTVAFALVNLAWAERTGGDYASALAHVEAAGSALAAVDDRSLQAWLQTTRAAVAHDLGRHDEALEILETVVSSWREGSNRSLLAWASTLLGGVCLALGDTDKAESCLEEGLAIWERIESPWGIAWGLQGLARVALTRGFSDRAASLTREAVGLRRSLGDRLGVVVGLESAADIWLGKGEAERAARLLGAADRVRRELETPLPASRRQEREGTLSRLRGQLGDERCDTVRAEGERLTDEEAAGLIAD